MCITSDKANLPPTIVGVWDINHSTLGYRHVLAYQNRPQNLVDHPNCMILAIPSLENIKVDDILNTENDPEFLWKMANSVAELKNFTRGKEDDNVVHEMGIYHIAILNDMTQDKVNTCLNNIPAEKRPNISNDLMDFYRKTYPDFPILICCFNSKSSKDASPILVHFKPFSPNTFMFNTVEAHGEVPQLGEPTLFQQRIIIGSHRIKSAFGDYKAFDYSGVSPELLPFLPRFGQGEHIFANLPNLDILIDNRSMAENDSIPLDLNIISAQKNS